MAGVVLLRTALLHVVTTVGLGSVGVPDGSAEYSEAALATASRAVEGFRSDLGGTEIMVSGAACGVRTCHEAVLWGCYPSITVVSTLAMMFWDGAMPGVVCVVMCGVVWCGVMLDVSGA